MRGHRSARSKGRQDVADDTEGLAGGGADLPPASALILIKQIRDGGPTWSRKLRRQVESRSRPGFLIYDARADDPLRKDRPSHLRV